MVAPAGMWTLLASAMRLPISSGGRPPKCEAAIAARTSSSVMASTTGYKPCPDDNAQPIQVHTRKLLQPRMPGKVTKRGPLNPLEIAFGVSWRIDAGFRPVPEVTIDHGLARRAQDWARMVDKYHPSNLDMSMRRLLASVSVRYDPMDGFVDAVINWEN